MISYLTEVNDFENNNILTRYEMARAPAVLIAPKLCLVKNYLAKFILSNTRQ